MTCRIAHIYAASVQSEQPNVPSGGQLAWMISHIVGMSKASPLCES